MAVGLGYMLGLRIPQNVDSPYKAPGPSDFWRRWHISLSTCMRDYLYIPFGGNRGGVFALFLAAVVGRACFRATDFRMARAVVCTRFLPDPGSLAAKVPLVVLAIAIAGLWAPHLPSALATGRPHFLYFLF